MSFSSKGSKATLHLDPQASGSWPFFYSLNMISAFPPQGFVLNAPVKHSFCHNLPLLDCFSS